MINIVIIGANLAGLNCALNLDLKKFNVTVIDKGKNPGNKCCAGGTSSKSAKYIPKKFWEKSFDKAYYYHQKHSCYVDLKNTPMFTYDRVKYINFLLNEAKKKGIKIVLGEKIELNDINKNNIAGIDYDILIGADGAMSVVRRHLGLKTKTCGIVEAKMKSSEKLIFRFERDFGAGYFWVFPHKNFSSIGCTGNFKEFEAFCRKEKIDYYDKQGSVISTHYCGYKFGNKYLIGEAAGIVSRITGEGVFQAIESGVGLANELNSGTKSLEIKSLIKEMRFHNRFMAILVYFFAPFVIKLNLSPKRLSKATAWLNVK